VYDKNGGVIGTESTYADVDLLKPGQKSTFKFFASADDFKGMDHYELSIEWQNHKDSSQGYLEKAKIYKDNTANANDTGSSFSDNHKSDSDKAKSQADKIKDKAEKVGKKTSNKLGDLLDKASKKIRKGID
jgi:ElaB/YqjD/DUF883 family membrane-anchored ribosome-binding protein